MPEGFTGTTDDGIAADLPVTAPGGVAARAAPSRPTGARPGKATDNGYIEAFNSKLRSECLNTHWFIDLADARKKLEAWRRDYNQVGPHNAIGYNVPIDLHIPGGVASSLP